MIFGDTIAAIATAPGRGGVAVIRVSGPESVSIAAQLTGLAAERGEGEARVKGEAASQPLVRIRKVRFPLSGWEAASPLGASPLGASTLSPESPSFAATLIDEAVVIVFRAPHSYTGEDVVEFQCHGGSVTPRRVLEACLATGARLAHCGEFTQRAYLNGRLDYDQAESVLDLIDAKTARAADAALEGLSGRKRRELNDLYEAALDLSTRLEHALDVDEGELPDGFAAEAEAEVGRLEARLRDAIRRSREGKILREGALVVLAGPPNAGKSSLMNALLEENRAIVSDVPGTTRDSIEEGLDLDGWPIRLVDTAGLRETDDAIEGEGVRRSEELVSRADVVLCLGNVDVGKCGSGGDRAISVHAKCDLGRGEGLNVSAKTGEGLDDLRAAIVAKIRERAAAAEADSPVDGSRLAVLQEALALLSKFQLPAPSSQLPAPCSKLPALSSKLPAKTPPVPDLVLVANGVRQVAERLGALVGAVYTSDLLDNLFSRFCVGK